MLPARDERKIKDVWPWCNYIAWLFPLLQGMLCMGLLRLWVETWCLNGQQLTLARGLGLSGFKVPKELV